jgi:hypothetical protein
MAKFGTWHGGGIYSKRRTDKDGEPKEVFYCRVWIPSMRKMMVWKAGHTLKQAERKLRQLQGDPDKAAAERMAARAAKKREKAAKVAAVTVEKLAADFIGSYVSEGGGDFHKKILRSAVEYLGESPAVSLSPADVDRYLKSRRAQRKDDGIPKVGEESLRKEVIYLKMMLQWARTERRHRRGLRPAGQETAPEG